METKEVGFLTLSHYKLDQCNFVAQVTECAQSYGEGYSNTILELLVMAALKAMMIP